MEKWTKKQIRDAFENIGNWTKHEFTYDRVMVCRDFREMEFHMFGMDFVSLQINQYLPDIDAMMHIGKKEDENTVMLDGRPAVREWHEIALYLKHAVTNNNDPSDYTLVSISRTNALDMLYDAYKGMKETA